MLKMIQGDHLCLTIGTWSPLRFDWWTWRLWLGDLHDSGGVYFTHPFGFLRMEFWTPAIEPPCSK